MSDNTTFIREDPWRIFRIMSEFVDSFQTMSQVGPAVTIFGSARTKPNDKYYKAAQEIAKGLAKHNLAVITGGGPGIMEAANRGAHDAGAPSIGFNITLPMEQEPNAYSTPDLTFRFHYFAMRKMHFAIRAAALVVFPGGFGTMDELFEILTLRQTGKMDDALPVVLYDSTFWKSLINFQHFVDSGMVAARDLDLFGFADSPRQAWDQLVKRGLKVPGVTA
jgi:hypothetical protein